MDDATYKEVAMAWSGSCENCLAVVVVYPHPESSELDAELISSGPDEWEPFSSCYVCDGRLDWNGSDPVASVIR